MNCSQDYKKVLGCPSQTMRILLVDDEIELTEPLSRVLNREGYAVDVAYDGATGRDRKSVV